MENRYKLVYGRQSIKDLSKIDKYQAKLITSWLNKNINDCINPREVSGYSELKGEWKGLVRYRIGNYRIICDVNEKELIILAIEIGHRKDIYK